MKILVDFNQDGSIHAVKNTEKYNLSEDEIKDQVSKGNMRFGYGKWMLKEIPSDLEDAFNFLLGDKGYKVYSDIEDLDDSINVLSTRLDSISEEMFGMTSTFEHIQKMFSDFIKSWKDTDIASLRNSE